MTIVKHWTNCMRANASGGRAVRTEVSRKGGRRHRPRERQAPASLYSRCLQGVSNIDRTAPVFKDVDFLSQKKPGGGFSSLKK